MIKTIPKEIVEKMEQTNQLISEVETWLNENIDLDRGDEHFVDLDNGGNPFPYFTIVDKPKGKLQSNGWWVDSHQQGEDWYTGTSYFPLEDGRYIEFGFDY